MKRNSNIDMSDIQQVKEKSHKLNFNEGIYAFKKIAKKKLFI